MRTTYELSDQTREVLTDAVASIATEWDKNPSYLYQILSNVECDPFAKFRAMYAAAVRAGVDVTAWDANLVEIKARYRVEKPLPEVLCDKMKGDTKTNTLLVDALKDGKVDEHERRPILRAVAVERNTLDYIEAIVTETTKENLEFARAAVRRMK